MCFDSAGVKTANWRRLGSVVQFNGEMLWNTFPAIIKHKNSCKGEGIYLILAQSDLDEFLSNHRDTQNYIIEAFASSMTKEYRLHVTKDGCFYTCRKMLKTDAEDRWHRHDSNSVWIMEENPLFEKPKNWDNVVAESVKALNAVGLDVGAVDLKIQSEKGRREDFVPEFIILEINSGPSLGSVTEIKYREELPKIINDKIANYGRS